MRRAINKLLHVIMRITPGNSIRVKILKKLGAHIASYVCISQNFFVFDAGRTDLLTIEENVGIGPNVTILIHSDPFPSPINKIYPKSWRPVHIKKGVWVGACSTILGGVTIGEYSIIGAGSVVTKDVPPRSLVVGVPAKVIKDLTNPITINEA